MKIVHIRKILSTSICFISLLLMASAPAFAAENAKTKDETTPKEDKEAPANDKLPKPLAANDELEPESEEKKDETPATTEATTAATGPSQETQTPQLADLKAQIKAEILAEMAAASKSPAKDEKLFAKPGEGKVDWREGHCLLPLQYNFFAEFKSVRFHFFKSKIEFKVPKK